MERDPEPLLSGNRPMPNSVLVVESHTDLRTVIVEALTRADYRCDAVGSGTDALMKLRERDYAFIVIDTDSPTSMTALCEAVNARPAWRERLILISDDEAAPDQRPLHKPFDRRDLLSRVHH